MHPKYNSLQLTPLFLRLICNVRIIQIIVLTNIFIKTLIWEKSAQQIINFDGNMDSRVNNAS